MLRLDGEAREPNPVNLDDGLARMTLGVHRLEDQLLLVLDVEHVLDVAIASMAA